MSVSGVGRKRTYQRDANGAAAVFERFCLGENKQRNASDEPRH